MKEHRGNTVREKIKDFEVGFENLAEELGISRPTLFRWLNEPKLALSKIQRISKAAKIDFREEFPELNDSEKIRSNADNSDYKEKYLEILEKYTLLQEAAMKYGFGAESGQQEGK